MYQYLICGYKRGDVDDYGANVKILGLYDSLEDVNKFEDSLGQDRIYRNTKRGKIWITWVFKLKKNAVQKPILDIRNTRNALKPKSIYD